MSKKKTARIEVRSTTKGEGKATVKGHPMNTFRYNSKSGHPSYVFHQHGDDFEYIGLTHDDREENVRLNVNPDPNDTATSYLHNEPEILHSKRMKKILKGWKFDESDLPKVEKIKQKSKFRK